MQLKMKCECGGKIEKMTTVWKGIQVRGWRCATCHEELIHPSDAQKALDIERARKNNLLTVKLRRVGKSSVVTVPQPIVQAEHLRQGQKLEWRIEAGKLVLSQYSRKVYIRDSNGNHHGAARPVQALLPRLPEGAAIP